MDTVRCTGRKLGTVNPQAMPAKLDKAIITKRVASQGDAPREHFLPMDKYRAPPQGTGLA